MDKRHLDIKGWVTIPGIVPDHHVELLRDRGIRLREWVESMKGLSANHGPFQYCDLPIVPCAATIDGSLWEVYRSDYMWDVANTLLGTNPYIFNDQMVYKLPNDRMEFGWHTDNQFGNANQIGARTINCSIIIDDFTPDNGALTVRNADNNKIVDLYPKSGDIIAIDGNCEHSSGKNNTNQPRGLYACVYSDKALHFEQYYNNYFEKP